MDSQRQPRPHPRALGSDGPHRPGLLHGRIDEREQLDRAPHRHAGDRAPNVSTPTTIRYVAHVRNATNEQEAFTTIVPVVGSVNHIHVHWDPVDPTAPGCCAGGATSGSTATLIGTPAMLTAPTVTTPITIRYVAHIGNSAGQESFSTIVSVTVVPATASPSP